MPITVNIGIGTGFGAGCNAGIICVAQTILYVINYILVPVLFAVAFIVFLYGIAKAYIFSHGDAEAVGQGHKLILWGLIGFVAMVSLWGMVNVVSMTFGLSGYSAPPTPSSISPYSTTGVYGQQAQPVYIERCQVEGTC